MGPILTDILYFSEFFLVGGFAETLLPGAERPKVLHGLGANVGEELHHHTAHRDPPDRDVEEAARPLHSSHGAV